MVKYSPSHSRILAEPINVKILTKNHPNSLHSHPDSPHSQPDPHTHSSHTPHSQHSFPHSPHSCPDSERSHPDSPRFHHSPHSVSRFSIPDFTDCLLVILIVNKNLLWCSKCSNLPLNMLLIFVCAVVVVGSFFIELLIP